MDDGPRIGGLQALLLIIGGTGVFVTLTAGTWLSGVVAVTALAGLVWLELYARRRAREEREEEERRLRRSSIAHLDFDERP
jgi:Flp pilus assembly protein TadB